jgi:hypothetical protein
VAGSVPQWWNVKTQTTTRPSPRGAALDYALAAALYVAALLCLLALLIPPAIEHLIGALSPNRGKRGRTLEAPPQGIAWLTSLIH